MSKRIVSFFMAFVIMIFAAPMAFAASEPVSSCNGWTWWKQNFPSFVSSVVLVFSPQGAVCPSNDSPDGCHRGHLTTGVVGTDGNYACTCDYCGQSFLVPESEIDFPTAYDEYVKTLPAQGFDSTNGLIYTVPSTYVRVGFGDRSLNNVARYISFGPDPYPGEKVLDSNVSLIGSSSSFDCSGDDRVNLTAKYAYFGVAPLAGTYIPIQQSYNIYLWSESGMETQCIDLWASTDSFNCSQGGNLRSPNFNEVPLYYVLRLKVSFPPVSFQVVPDDTSIVEGDTYNVNSRPASISGDFGIIGDNGQISKVEGDTIVNEANKTVYNPVTNTTNNVTDWQYDYSTRTYNLTLDNGKTQTVTYGDENVTISEVDNSSGDTITNNYTVYYVLENTGSGSGTDTPGSETPAPCNHTWTETSSTAATCTVPGSRHLTCSLCNQTKTETIPAPGHTWQIKQTVSTQYDETGQLTQQGYTIFECSVCHEQYKSEDGTAPPGGGTGADPGADSLLDKLGQLLGSGLGGIVELLGAAVGKLLDALIALVELITGKLAEVVSAVLSIFDEIPALFGGFLNFLGAVFPFLPSEIMALLTLGIAAVVAIGIIKAIRR